MKAKNPKANGASVHISLPNVDMPAFEQIARAVGSDRTKLIEFLVNTFTRAYQKAPGLSGVARRGEESGLSSAVRRPSSDRLVWPPRFMTTREETRLQDHPAGHP